MTRTLLFVSIFIFFAFQLNSQPWHYDFGTTTGSYSTNNSASTVFLPNPPSGTSRIRIGNGQGGVFYLENQAVLFGSDSYLRFFAPTGASSNKFSLYDYSPGNCFTLRFRMRLGSSNGSGSGATSGTWYLFTGDGATYSDNNNFNSSQCFTGLQMTFGSSGSVTTNYRSGASWVTSGMTPTPFVQGVTYVIEIYGNNSSTIQFYFYNDTTRSVASNKWDFWLDGVLAGNDLSKAQLADNANIDSWMFYAQSSFDNSANIFLDDIDYTNVVATTPMPVKLTSFTVSSTGRNSLLKWSTDWEINNAGFDIERSNKDAGGANNSSWSKVGFVPGSGTISVPRYYSFKDKNLSTGSYNYRLKQIDYNGNYEYFTCSDAALIGKPAEFTLNQNYPNPSNPKSRIDFQIPFDGNVMLSVYDMTGKEISTLINDFRKADYYSVEFDGSNLASGVYFYKITAVAEEQTLSKTLKMILVK